MQQINTWVAVVRLHTGAVWSFVVVADDEKGARSKLRGQVVEQAYRLRVPGPMLPFDVLKLRRSVSIPI